MIIEAMKQALEALEDVCVLTDREWQAVHKNKANELRQAIAELEKQEAVALRRGDILRCIETDDLCTVWATSTTGKTLVYWGGNDFDDYTAEQIGELFWVEPRAKDLEDAAERSDNYAAFHAGVRYANTHPQPNREVLQAEGKHPAPCARHCEANAFQIEIRNLKSQLATKTKSEWVGLTDEDIEAAYWQTNPSLERFARAIEAKLKEKNNG